MWPGGRITQIRTRLGGVPVRLSALMDGASALSALTIGLMVAILPRNASGA